MLYYGLTREVPLILLGCKSDLKIEDPNRASIPFVTTEEAQKAARQIGAVDALECSSMDSDSIRRIGDFLGWHGYYSHFVKSGTHCKDIGRFSKLWNGLQTLLRPRQND
jgi:hypothetical protein